MPSSTKQADTDCRKCNRRRIRCDRTLPQCLKCGSRGFPCPGYNKRLKWICGAASKGPNRLDFSSTESPSKDPESGVPRPPEIVAKDEPTPSQLSLASLSPPSLSSCVQLIPSVPHIVQKPALLDHYIRVVSSQLAWYEDGSNPWCQLILPLASQSPSLVSTVLGLAASNIGSRLSDGNPDKAICLQAMSLYREEALTLLAKDLEEFRCCVDVSGARSHFLRNAIIASILLLSYLEVHWPLSGIWRTHLDAAQSVSNYPLPKMSDDSTSKFLSEELLAATTWPLLTDYTPNHTSQTCGTTFDELLVPARFNTQLLIFTPFLSILRYITGVERRFSTQVLEPERQTHLKKAFLEVQSALAEARVSATILLPSRLSLCTDSHVKDIQCLIDAYFHATTLYSYRALLENSIEPDVLLEVRTKLFGSLLAFSNPDSCSQDQPWPLFVAGTECMDDLAGQHWIEHRLHSIIQLYCAIDRPRMLNFLKTFWEQKQERNWIKYARKWTEDQHQFLIL